MSCFVVTQIEMCLHLNYRTFSDHVLAQLGDTRYLLRIGVKTSCRSVSYRFLVAVDRGDLPQCVVIYRREAMVYAFCPRHGIRAFAYRACLRQGLPSIGIKASPSRWPVLHLIYSIRSRPSRTMVNTACVGIQYASSHLCCLIMHRLSTATLLLPPRPTRPHLGSCGINGIGTFPLSIAASATHIYAQSASSNATVNIDLRCRGDGISIVTKVSGSYDTLSRSWSVASNTSSYSQSPSSLVA